MRFAFMGVTYKNAGLEIREQAAFTDNQKIEFLQKANESGVDQCVILSTCNRSEICFFYEEELQYTQMKSLYREMFSQMELGIYMEERTGHDALEYLFRITAGLESLVPGEDQILGQVKDALDFSRTLGYSKKEMNRVVQNAVACAKQIKTKYKMSEKPLSVSYVAVRQLEERVGIQGKQVLIIGSGKTAELALTYMDAYGAGKIWICNRTFSRAKELQGKFPDIRVIEYKKRYDIMKQCDIVISATASPHLVIRREEAGQLVSPIVFVDLASPRDIDVAFAEDSQAELMNLDTLQSIVSENQRERNRLVELSCSDLEAAVVETEEWMRSSKIDGTIKSLQQRCDEIVGDSYAYLNRKLELNTREQRIMKKVLSSSLYRLLREPIQELKQLDTEEQQVQYQEILKQLFRI